MEQITQYAPIAQNAVGTLLTAKGANDSGKAAERAAKYQAAQMEQNAGQEQAAGSMAAREEARKSALIASRAIAVAAASGAGTLDPTVVKILQGIDAEGALASATQIYNGDERARGLKDQAKATRYEGKSARAAGRLRAQTTVLSGIQRQTPTWGAASDRPGAVRDLDDKAGQISSRYN